MPSPLSTSRRGRCALAPGAPWSRWPRELRPEEGDNGPIDSPPPRFLLWIDGVGGYLVCLGNRLTFGQGLADARVDVPLVADVSRLHATLTRDAEGYVLEAVRPIQVNAATVTRALLQPGDRVTLGVSCQLLFRLPVPGNNTARLDLVSGHRLPTAVDGVAADGRDAGPGAWVAVAHRRAGPEAADDPFPPPRRAGLAARRRSCASTARRAAGGRSSARGATVSGEDIAFAIEPTP